MTTKAGEDDVAVPKTTKHPKRKWSLRWFLGGCIATCFSMVYFVAPFYMLSCLLAAFWVRPIHYVLWYAAPLIISAILPPIGSPRVIQLLAPMLDYFDYEEIHESDGWENIIEKGINYLVVFQPHGALSYAGIASAVNAPPEFRGKLPTAVADAVLYTPIVKHVLGIFGLISASKASMRKTLKQRGVEGTVVLYVGGLAELFLSCENEERIYLQKRKGFIKLALTEGVDIIPVYLFGNTTVLSVLKTGLLASISRKFQVSLTYIWGKYYLPIPRDCKLLYVSGKPLGMPQIDNPTQQDIDKWHDTYCQQVTRIFNQYKERVPEYKHKKLEIV